MITPMTKIKWFVHEDIYDDDEDYVRRKFKDQLGRDATDEEIDIVAKALYEINVEIDLKTRKITIANDEDNDEQRSPG